jgi:hypothetical protein
MFRRKNKKKTGIEQHAHTIADNAADAHRPASSPGKGKESYYAAGPVPGLAKPVQTKIATGSAGGKYEREADRVADTVMRMPEKSTCPECPEKEEVQAQSMAGQITPLVQRQTEPEEEEDMAVQKLGDETEEEEKEVPESVQGMAIQRMEDEEEEENPEPVGGVQGKFIQRREVEPEEEKEDEPVNLQAKAHTGPTPGVSAASAIRSLKGGGRPLSPSVRGYFEPRFGVDFSRVRVHTGPEAGETAEAINAKAFTTGKDVVFGAGQFAPGTARGNHLLAHELTHVVQQGAASGSEHVQRDANDFRVRGRYSPSAGRLANWAFFEWAGHNLGSHQARVEAFAGTVTNPVTLYGYASEEGSGTYNDSLVDRRMNEVESVLLGRGVVVTAKHRRTAASAELIDYRRWRAVEMVEGAGSSIPDCTIAGADRISFTPAEAGTFTTIREDAKDKIDSALGDLAAAPPTAATIAHVTRLFGAGASLPAIHANLTKIRTELLAITPSRRQKGTECNSTCRAGAIAYYSRSRADYTFCERWFNMSSSNNQARNLIHEAAHGTPTLHTIDYSYRWERMIEHLGDLEPASALDNSDSYSLLVMLLNGVSSVGGFPPPPDVFAGSMTSTQVDKTRRAIMYMQNWVTASSGRTRYLFRVLHARVGLPWPASGSGRDTMAATQPLFGLTPLWRAPRNRDAWKVAAIFDRYQTMKTRLKSPLEISESTTGSTTWEAGPGTKVTVHPTFYGRSLKSRIKLLLRRLVAVVPYVSRALVGAYVKLADKLRRMKGIGPP